MLVEIPLFRVRWVSGDANVDGGMNVVNADICGNVMLTSGTSFVQQVHIRATTASSSSTRGVGGVWRSGNRKRECWRYAGVVGDMDGVVVRSYMAV
jgi:hypothetical protein